MTKKSQKRLDRISSIIFALPVAYLFFKNLLPICIQNWIEAWIEAIFGCMAFIMGVLYPWLNRKNKIIELQKTLIRNKHAVYLLNNLRKNCHQMDDNLLELLYIQYYSLGDLDEEIEDRSEYIKKEMKNPKFNQEMSQTIDGAMAMYELTDLLESSQQ